MKKIILLSLLYISFVSCKKTETIETTNFSKTDTLTEINSTQVDYTNSDSVNLLELQTECDCIDAGLIVATELVSYDNKKLTSIQQGRVNELKIKLKKIIDLSYELGTRIGLEKAENGFLRAKWSFHSCENYKKLNKINPIKESLVADTTSIKIIEN